MALRMSKPNKQALSDYRRDARYIEITARLAQIERDLPGAQQAADDANSKLAPFAAERFAMEKQVLAGRMSESELTPLLAQELDLKRTAAMASIHVDDLISERAKLEKELPRVRAHAKQEAAATLTGEYKQALTDIRDALARVMASADRIRGVLQQVDDQFRGAQPNWMDQPTDEDGFPRHLNLPHKYLEGERLPDLLKRVEAVLSQLSD